MVSLAELKKKASTVGGARGEQAAAYYTKTKGPSSKYTPSAIENGPGLSAADLTTNSTSLREYNTVQVHRPPPPPKRNGDNSSSSTPPLSSNSTPRYGASSSAASSSSHNTASVPPSAPARKPAELTPRTTPAPPYQYAANNDLPTRNTLPPPSSSAATSRARTGSNASNAGLKLFSQYNQQDKEEFFGMLDEYFGSKVKATAASSSNSVPNSAPTRNPQYSNSSSTPKTIQASTISTPSLPSYPPPQSHSSSALSLLHYILYDSYSSSWFTTPSATPPPLTTRNDVRSASSWTQTGDLKSLIGVVLFGDASIIWYKLSWSVREEKANQLGSNFERVKKEGKYRPIPEAWDGERLYEASEMYGPVLAEFAEKSVTGRRPVARGECWDIANEGLNSIINGRKDLPAPFPSIARTHGNLMFYGKAGGKNLGVWRGGDSYVRPGDIVEWRIVKIREVGMQIGAYVTLGAPEHTAIITSASPPNSIPSDGMPYPIADLVSLTVVEQSQGALPAEKVYDMSAMSEGEVWIYRPVPLIEYVGSEVSPTWPPQCETWEIGQLE